MRSSNTSPNRTSSTVDIRFSDCRASSSTSPSRPPRSTRTFVRGRLAFDGSSVRGFQSIHESDMMLLPRRRDRADRSVSARPAP
ncbi:hypothetical protein GS421_05585 [Rhodococcus hoagii]|nr:hypothetical protein [Prescottella equi]